MPWVSMFEDDRIARGRGALDQFFTKNRKFGKHTAFGTSFEEIWDAGTTHTWPTAAAAVRIKSGGDATDTAAGNGAREVTVEGLDENWAVASEAIATAGASQSSATTTTFIRIHRAYVSEMGTYHGANTAAITIEDASANVLAYVGAGVGQTQMTQFTTPINTTSSLSRLSFTIDTGKTVDVRLYKYPNANDVVAGYSGAKRLVHEWLGIKDFMVVDNLDSVETLDGATDVWFEAKVTTGTAAISIHYDVTVSKI